MRYTWANGKGGCGKSTGVTAVASELHRRGRSVLVVDLDPVSKTAMTWRRCRPGDVAGPTVIAMAAGFSAELEMLASQFDDVILDTPGADQKVVREAIMASDVVLVPSQPTPPDLWATATTVATVRQACGIRPDMKAVIVLTRVNARQAYTSEAKSILESFALPVLPTTIGQRAAYQHAMAAGIGPTTLDPHSKASAEIMALVEALEILTDGQNDSTEIACA